MLVSGISTSYMNKSIADNNKKKRAKCIQEVSRMEKMVEIDAEEKENREFRVDPDSKDLSIIL